MIITFLMSDNELMMQRGLGYFLAVAGAVIVTYFLFRWIFSIKKRIDQNDEIIALLKKIEEKQK